MARAMKNAMRSGPRKVTLAGIEWTEQYGYYRAMLNGWLELQLQPDKNVYSVLKPGGVIVWVVGDATKDGSETGTSMEQALHFKRLGLNLHDTMVYRMRGTGAKGSNLAYWQAWEYMLVLSNGKPKTVNRLTAERSSDWKAGGRLTKDRHPS